MNKLLFLCVLVFGLFASEMVFAAAHPMLSREQDRRQRVLFQGAHKGILSDCQSALSARDKRNAISVDIRNIVGQTALMIAIKYNHMDIVEYLLENGADANAVDGTGWTPLAFAAKYATPENTAALIEMLLDKGASDVAEAIKVAHRDRRHDVVAIITEVWGRRLYREAVGPTR